MPYWAVIIAAVVLVVGYYLLTQQAKERRRDRVSGDFARLPDFYANQTYTDTKGEAALGFDDRRRRVAVARKHGGTGTRVYSFAHIESAEVLQNDHVIQTAVKPESAGGSATVREPGQVNASGGPAAAQSGDFSSLFGSTQQGPRPGITGLPVLRPIAGQLTRIAVRVTFQDAAEGDEVLLRFYEDKPVNVEGLVAERAFADAQILMGALATAMKRAGVPHRAAAGRSSSTTSSL